MNKEQKLSNLVLCSLFVVLPHPQPPLVPKPFFLEQPHLEEFDIQAALSLPKKAVDLRVAWVAEDTAVEAAVGLTPITADMAKTQPLIGAYRALVWRGHIQ